MSNNLPPVYVIRHGETDWNVEGRFQGGMDVALNEKGRGQARRNGLALARYLGQSVSRFDFVASPLSRARDTMMILRESMGLPPDDYRTDDRLLEVCYGDWEGHTLAELKAITPEKIAERAENKWGFLPPGDNAESYEILSWRVAAWLQSVDRPTVCVSHGGIIRTLHHLVRGMSGDDAAELPTPQDRILKLEGDTIGWLSPDPAGV